MFDRIHVALLVLAAIARLGASVTVSVELEQRAIARIQEVIRDNRGNPPGNSGIEHVSSTPRLALLTVFVIITASVWYKLGIRSSPYMHA